MKTLVIIGAGFSGAVTAAQFMRHSPPGVRIVLVNRSGAMARGLAYGTNSSLHLLNVPAGNMSADLDDPDHFLRFCNGQDSLYTASSFVPRKTYGEYLASVLDDAEKHCASGVVLERVVAEVRSLRPEGNGAVLELVDGQRIRADQVVLAFGNFSPLDPPGFSASLGAERYQSDPWGSTSAETVEANSPVLLVGAGLTALDVSLSLLQQGHRGPIYMVSRRGLRPLPHRPQRSAYTGPLDIAEKLLRERPSVRGYMRLIRREISEVQPKGLDWRDLLAAMRSITPDLWVRLPDIERRRFLRHAQPYWDAHRHRVAPAAYQRFEEAVLNGQIHSLAGRVQKVVGSSEAVAVDIQLRSSGRLEQIKVARVINCTGPNTNLRRVDDKLISQLREDGLVQLDPLGLGLNVDQWLAVKGKDGNTVPWLHYVGPMLKADLWEATAVPELRQHAKHLALRLADQFG
ncbi:FAD/NAD(P)-binding protein [Pseudomonas koreensis]|uniref:FAD/NAD(P)-binding protein n=1 Tax=Pseudomonas koreensis TaxID=198620 RepID=UPI0021C94D1B|nr:FAD/NAD(P)-binding protein [Pseudomonas koreensis]MCU0071551.1 FAD/NAD(P)-binding protein [Pseudomonas koreensis]